MRPHVGEREALMRSKDCLAKLVPTRPPLPALFRATALSCRPFLLG
jgi:hypothetical protein